MPIYQFERIMKKNTQKIKSKYFFWVLRSTSWRVSVMWGTCAQVFIDSNSKLNKLIFGHLKDKNVNRCWFDWAAAIFSLIIFYILIFAQEIKIGMAYTYWITLICSAGMFAPRKESSSQGERVKLNQSNNSPFQARHIKIAA